MRLRTPGVAQHLKLFLLSANALFSSVCLALHKLDHLVGMRLINSSSALLLLAGTSRRVQGACAAQGM